VRGRGFSLSAKQRRRRKRLPKSFRAGFGKPPAALRRRCPLPPPPREYLRVEEAVTQRRREFLPYRALPRAHHPNKKHGAAFQALLYLGAGLGGVGTVHGVGARVRFSARSRRATGGGFGHRAGAWSVTQHASRGDMRVGDARGYARHGACRRSTCAGRCDARTGGRQNKAHSSKGFANITFLCPKRNDPGVVRHSRAATARGGACLPLSR
jgi:hypothetical protein